MTYVSDCNDFSEIAPFRPKRRYDNYINQRETPMTNNTRFDLTDAEMQALQEATPEQLAAAAAELSQDPAFWAEMVRAFVEGFMRGLSK
jgi:hypothetical protein